MSLSFARKGGPGGECREDATSSEGRGTHGGATDLQNEAAAPP